MKDFAILLRRVCRIISCCLILTSTLGGLIFVKEARSDLVVWLAFAGLFSLLAGYLMAWIINLAFVRKLKDHFPEWKKEIIQFFFGSFRVFRSPIVAGGSLPSYILNDPDGEIVREARDTVRRFSLCWIYIPSTLVVTLILIFLLFGY